MQFPNRQTWPRWARALTSPWVLSPVLVLTLLVGSFEAYGAYTRSQPTRYARGGDAFDTPGSSSGGANGGTTSRSGRQGKQAPPPAGIGAAPRLGGGGTKLAASSRHTTPSTAPGAGGGGNGGRTSRRGHTRHRTPASTAVTYPAAGTYGLSVSGSEHVKFGPFSACTNTFPTSSALVVKPASGEPAGSYDFDLRLYPGKANKHDERHIYRYTSSGVTLGYEQATVTCSGVKQSTTVDYSPSQLRVPGSLSVGQTWRDHGGDSKRTETGTAKVVGTTHVRIGGTSYVTYVIDTQLKLSGSESGSRHQRWWWAPSLGIPVKWQESLSAKRSGADYSENITCTVVSGP